MNPAYNTDFNRTPEAPTTLELPIREQTARERPQLSLLEIWIEIISHLFDGNPGSTIHAWLVLRRVSHQLKKATELAFIGCERIKLLGCEFQLDPDHPFYPKYFDFCRVIGDRLIFVESDRRPDDQQDADGWLAGMQAALSHDSHPDPHSPPYFLTLNPIATNDIELTGLELNKDKRELSVLWKPMITKMLLEEYLIASRLMLLSKTYVKSRHPFSDDKHCFYHWSENVRKVARSSRYSGYTSHLRNLILASLPANPTYTTWMISDSRITDMWYKDWKQLKAGWSDICAGQECIKDMYRITGAKTPASSKDSSGADSKK